MYAAHKQAILGCSDKPRAATCIPLQPWIQEQVKNRTRQVIAMSDPWLEVEITPDSDASHVSRLLS